MIEVIIALLLHVQPPRDARPATAPATARISGVVTTDEAQPRPLRRARVILNGAALNVPRTAITADNGTFVFDRLPGGRFTVSAAKDAYLPMAYGAKRPARPGAGINLADQQSVALTLRLTRGAVITGTVIDVDGQPAQGISVSALSRRFGASFTGAGDYIYASAGSPPQGTTDDRGSYRIYGLPPGEYVVSAQPLARSTGPPGTVGTIVQPMMRGGVSPRKMILTQMFHPGTPDVSRASRVTVRAGEERSGIDVQLEYVPLATVSGTISAPPGSAPVRISLWRGDELARFQTGPVATADDQGRFQFLAIAPGQYRLNARIAPASQGSGGRGGVSGAGVQYALADVVVNGEDVEVALTLQPGLSIAGRIVFESDAAVPPQLPAQSRINIPLVAGNGGWPMPQLVLDGTSFRLDGIMPGRYRALPTMQGLRSPVGRWWLKSLSAGGRELLDAPLDIQQSFDDAIITFTDRTSELSGLVTNDGKPSPEVYVIAFSQDRTTWFLNSRRIASVRTDREGRYKIGNLPPGNYRMIATTDVEPNEWFDPLALERLFPLATPVTISGPNVTTLNLQHR